jgi:hypothetical protein
MSASEADLVCEEARFREAFREGPLRSFLDEISFSAIPATVIPPKVIAVFIPKRK